MDVIAVGHAPAAHQKPGGVEVIGRAGDEGAQILPGFDFHRAGFIGIDGFDVVHLIGDLAVKAHIGKDVALLQFVQIGEHAGAGQPRVGRHHRMGARSADGQ